MKRLVFAGPSLCGAEAWQGITCRGPAAQGDLARAVLEGADVIGLVDGLYDDVAAPWHKEILFALSRGVTVVGGASLGALRAAECAPFGMIGVGTIYERYASGELDDDAAVAQLHAPAELDFMPLTEALVNAEATVEQTRRRRVIADDQASALIRAARSLHFKERTFERMAQIAMAGSEGRAGAVLAALGQNRVDLKRRDAELVVEAVREAGRSAAPQSWTLARTSTLDATLTSACHAADTHPQV